MSDWSRMEEQEVWVLDSQIVVVRMAHMLSFPPAYRS